jgi:hypothetical protein
VRLPLLRRAERGEPVAGQVLRLLPRFELTILFLAVADMVVKP